MRIRFTTQALAMLLTVVCLWTGLAPVAQSQAPRVARASSASVASQTRPVRAPARKTHPSRSSMRGHALAAATPDGLQELPALRTRTSDTYVGQDGVYTVHQSLQSINYQDATGAWQPISNTLIPASSDLAAAGFAYQNAGNDYTVAFAGSSGGPALEQITLHGITLDLAPLSAQAASSARSAMAASTRRHEPPAAAVSAQPVTTTVNVQPVTAAITANAATYAGVFASTDMQYSVENSAIKESLILRDAGAPSSFTFALQVAGGQLAGPGPNGRIPIVDANGVEQLDLAPPVAVDAQGAATPVSMTVAGVTQVQITIPAAWLADPARAWPIALDPTVVINPIQDRQIDSQNLGESWFNYCLPPNTPPDCPFNAATYGYGWDPAVNSYGAEPVDELGNSAGFYNLR